MFSSCRCSLPTTPSRGRHAQRRQSERSRRPWLQPSARARVSTGASGAADDRPLSARGDSREHSGESDRPLRCEWHQRPASHRTHLQAVCSESDRAHFGACAIGWSSSTRSWLSVDGLLRRRRSRRAGILSGFRGYRQAGFRRPSACAPCVTCARDVSLMLLSVSTGGFRTEWAIRVCTYRQRRAGRRVKPLRGSFASLRPCG